MREQDVQALGQERSGGGAGGALEELARSVVEHAQKIKASKGWESVHRQKRGGARGLSRQSHEGSHRKSAHWRSDMTRLTFQKNHLASDLNIECWDKGRI